MSSYFPRKVASPLAAFPFACAKSDAVSERSLYAGVMATVTITVTGIAETNLRLDKLKGMGWAVRPMRQATTLPQERMARYPSQSAGSRYVRTGTLGRRWTTQIDETPNKVIGRVGNNTEYAPWVQSRQFQAGVHRGRWQTEQDVAERSAREIVEFFRIAIERAANE